jgi:hypothetical protein
MSRPINRRLDIPGQTPSEDRMIGMMTALLSEVAVLRERLDTVERLAERAGAIERAAIEAFVPDEAAQAERDSLRRRLIEKVLRPVRDAVARSATGGSSR